MIEKCLKKTVVFLPPCFSLHRSSVHDGFTVLMQHIALCWREVRHQRRGEKQKQNINFTSGMQFREAKCHFLGLRELNTRRHLLWDDHSLGVDVSRDRRLRELSLILRAGETVRYFSPLSDFFCFCIVEDFFCISQFNKSARSLRS